MVLQSTCYHLCNPWGVTQNFCYPGFRKCYRVCNRWSVTQNFCYPGFRKCYRVCHRWGVTQNCCYPGFGKCYRVCNRWEFLLPSSNRAQKTYQGLVVWPPLPLRAPSPEARSALPPAAAAPPPHGPASAPSCACSAASSASWPPHSPGCHCCWLHCQTHHPGAYSGPCSTSACTSAASPAVPGGSQPDMDAIGQAVPVGVGSCGWTSHAA